MSLIALAARLLFQLPGDFDFPLTVCPTPGGQIGATELIMDVELVRLELDRKLKAGHRAFDIALLQQRLAQLVMRLAITRLELRDLAHQLNAPVDFLARQQGEAEVEPALNVIRVEGHL